MTTHSTAQWLGLPDHSFTHWWNLNGHWVEPPNYRRGGWSGALRAHWHGRGVYLKRQHQHLCREWLHPFGWPTLCREFRNLKTLQHLGIGCPAPLFFGRRGSSAVLVIEALDGFIALDQLAVPAGPLRQKLAEALGSCLGKLHRQHLQHGCLYPKHIFVRPVADDWQIALIDLEKMRWRVSAKGSARHDLSQFQRHQSLLDADDWQTLVLAHQQVFSA